MLQMSAGFVEDLTELQLHKFQMCGQQREFRRGQRGEKMVLIWTMG